MHAFACERCKKQSTNIGLLLLIRQGIGEGLFVIYNPSEMLLCPDLLAPICGGRIYFITLKARGKFSPEVHLKSHHIVNKQYKQIYV